ncbi:transmembrane protein 14C-like protein [Euroglyphus maynei]|uniref:Transmembrane protein 14C-like protein n=1 Tax=Euroglyphus maynei TaxID=6958 RepID=A0A1Y3BHG7_EURMA|nr:transmembrane protein 14C-like protein [Euroglyphus maynei]
MVDNSLLDTTTSSVRIIETDTFESNNFFGLKMPADFLSIGYACLVAVGGIIGYAKAGSVPSLIAGLGFGAVLGIGAYFTSVNPRNYHLLLASSLALAGLMGYRFYKSGKFMPAGLVFTLSAFMVLRFSLRFITNRNYF